MSEKIKQTPCEAEIKIHAFTPNITVKDAFVPPFSNDALNDMLMFDGIQPELAPTPHSVKVNIDCANCKFRSEPSATVFGNQGVALEIAISNTKSIIKSVCRKGDTATMPINIFEKDNFKMDDSLLPPILQPKPINNSPKTKSFLSRIKDQIR